MFQVRRLSKEASRRNWRDWESTIKKKFGKLVYFSFLPPWRKKPPVLLDNIYLCVRCDNMCNDASHLDLTEELDWINRINYLYSTVWLEKILTAETQHFEYISLCLSIHLSTKGHRSCFYLLPVVTLLKRDMGMVFFAWGSVTILQNTALLVFYFS